MAIENRRGEWVVQTVDTVWYNFQTSLLRVPIILNPGKGRISYEFGYKTFGGRYETGSGVGQLWRYTFGTIHALYGLDLT